MHLWMVDAFGTIFHSLVMQSCGWLRASINGRPDLSLALQFAYDQR
jgi:hypothetical protein